MLVLIKIAKLIITQLMYYQNKKTKGMNVRVDLHLHSYASAQNGDSIKWESVYDAVSRLYKSGVRLASFSDHNVFDVDLYLECTKLGKTGGMVFLPGIEVNIVRKNGMIANLIYIFPENLSMDQLLKIKQISKLEIPRNGITISKANKIFSDFDTIKIPHIGKSDHFKTEDLEGLEYDAFEVTNLKHSNYLKVTKDGLECSVVAFSDTHIWTSYPQQAKLITEMSLDPIGYKSLKERLKENKIFAKGIIND
ncbi:MAG: PHP domain-containing protein [Metamycoplasmataceae bacterium]